MGRRTAGTALRILVAFSIGILHNSSGKGERTENGVSISRPFGPHPSARSSPSGTLNRALLVYFTGALNVTSSFIRMPACPPGDDCSRMKVRRRLSFFALSLVVPLVLYAGFASRLITSHVGYEMDEAIYVESAVFVLRGSAPPP